MWTVIFINNIFNGVSVVQIPVYVVTIERILTRLIHCFTLTTHSLHYKFAWKLWTPLHAALYGFPPHHVQSDPINLAHDDNRTIMHGIMGRSRVLMQRVAPLSTESQSGFSAWFTAAILLPPSSHVILGQRERLTRCLSLQHLPALTHTAKKAGAREFIYSSPLLIGPFWKWYWHSTFVLQVMGVNCSSLWDRRLWSQRRLSKPHGVFIFHICSCSHFNTRFLRQIQHLESLCDLCADISVLNSIDLFRTVPKLLIARWEGSGGLDWMWLKQRIRFSWSQYTPLCFLCHPVCRRFSARIANT